ncbi:hypothetical protein [Phenylobacterium sp.]|uniref:hypothetical protein n=1 Tax=Phenylobacterium sp. TaxID=1871053 RepID=UPI0027369AB4|nr:hypothetical protein [Phenylobacterium sp.]MDP3853174.1 hypothetical protein [Phenylobacterium sp.]
METKFKFDLKAKVGLGPAENGEVIGRAEYLTSEPSYYVRYVAGDGRLVEAWWSESALTAA